MESQMILTYEYTKHKTHSLQIDALLMMCQTETVGTDAARYENDAQNRASIRETQTVSQQPKAPKQPPRMAV